MGLHTQMMVARKVVLATLMVVVGLVCGMTVGSGVSLGAVGTHTLTGSFGAGKLIGPLNMAVNEKTHDVYVTDEDGTGADRVVEFDASGSEIRSFNGSAAPSGVLKGDEAYIAVDNSSNPLLDPSAGDVYVVSINAALAGAHEVATVIDKFSEDGTYLGQITEGEPGEPLIRKESAKGIAVDPNGVVKFLHTSEPHGEVDSFSNAEHNEFLSAVKLPTGGPAGGFGVDSEDNLYFRDGLEFFQKLDSAGNPVIVELGAENSGYAVAVDQTKNDVYFDTPAGIEVFGPNGHLIEVFGPEYGDFDAGFGMAVDGSDGTFYLLWEREVLVFTAPIVPDVSSGDVSALGVEGSATLNGTVDPDGVPVTGCEFEYGAEVSYGHVAACSPMPGSGNGEVHVQAAVTGLEPGASYHYRLVASNANGSNAGIDRTFVDPRSPRVDEESTGNVAGSSARLDAQVDPEGAQTTYRFEYGLTSAYGMSVPVSGGNAGSGVGDVGVSVELQGLQPHTTYHWRVVVSSEVEPVAVGGDEVFTTQTTGGSVGLPDGREWELVSPVSKNGMQIVPAPLGLMQAADDGSGLAYYASGPFVAEPGSNRSLSQALAHRSSTGWTSSDIAPPRDRPALPSANSVSEYQFFSSDLSRALLEPWFEQNGYPSLAPAATERTPYVRDNGTGVYEPLVTATNVLSGTRFGKQRQNLVFAAATPDLSHVILKSNLNLTAEGSTSGFAFEGYILNDYEVFDGKLRFVNTLPANEPESLVFGAREVIVGSPEHINNVRHAVSDDGSRVFWGTIGANNTGGNGDDNELYMRDMSASDSVRVNVAQGVAEPSSNTAAFQFASADGSRVFFTEPNQLTSTPGAGLYVYDTDTGKLTLVTVPENASETVGVGSVEGTVIGGSEDGSYVYLVDTAVLKGNDQNSQGEQAVSGADNLYVVHSEEHDGVTEWATSFIAGLSSADRPDWGIPAWQSESHFPEMQSLTARVSPDGGFVAFMSEKSLTGYDNRDVNSGERDEEVYEYQASSGRLVCASCDPTGARPAGHVEGGGGGNPTLPELESAWSGRWVAASVPGWESVTTLVRGESSFYQPRYLADSGRLFFDSPEGLVPQDANGVEDAYEYEPQETGDCTSVSVTYSAGSAGCVSLISGGKGEKESVFVDASSSGNDVFFATTERLVGADIDSAYDVYDAHACSSEVPCFAPIVVSPPACDTVDSCKAAPVPQPAIFGAPASATFNGAGNITPTPTVKKKVKAKKKTPKKKPLKKHGSKHGRKHKAKSATRRSGR